MIKNFKIKYVSVLEVAGAEYELHNDLDMEGIHICFTRREISLRWIPSPSNKSGNALIIRFYGVKRCAFFGQLLPDNGREKTVSHVGYLPSVEFESANALLLEESFTPDCSMVLCFEDGSSINIDAETAEACVIGTVRPV